MAIGINKKKEYLFILSLIAVPVVIYLFFLKWQTTAIYGDDLYTFIYHQHLQKFSAEINISVVSGKYRPVHDFVLHTLLVLFDKHIGCYYLFNVFIQTINTFIFAGIAYLFLRSRYLALAFGLLIGISRFAFYNLTQLFMGGALEGLAMTFFLLTLYFILRSINRDDTATKKSRSVILSIVFASLCVFTHERYIVLLPFICIVLFFSPDLIVIPGRKKIFITILLAIAVTLNIVLKKYVFGLSFFMGTGGTTISFSFSAAISFLKEAVLSICQINTGPDYLIGFPYSRLSTSNTLLVLLSLALILALMIPYLYTVGKSVIQKQKKGYTDLSILIFLLVLFGLALAPAIVTIRLEQRWLQASYSIFILVIVIAACKVTSKSIFQKSILLFVVIIIGNVDYMYLRLGANQTYMSDSERTAKSFKTAIDNNTIHPITNRLFIWQSKIDNNSISSINWVLAEGNFFDFYQSQKKQLIYVDSVYEKSHSTINPIATFTKNTDQVIYIDNGVIDITNDYIKDSLKYTNTDEVPR